MLEFASTSDVREDINARPRHTRGTSCDPAKVLERSICSLLWKTIVSLPSPSSVPSAALRIDFFRAFDLMT